MKSLEGKTAKRGDRGGHFQHKKWLWDANTNPKGGGNKRESQGRIRRSVLMYTQNSVSVIGNSQGLSPPPFLLSSRPPFLSYRHWNLYIQPISRNLYLYELTHKAYLGPSFLDFLLPSFHIYTEVFISNIDVEICCWNRSSTRTISFLDSLHMCKKSASLISVHRDLMIRIENFTGPYSVNSMGKNQNKNNHTYAECICHNWISSLYTEDKHKTSDRLNFNRASEWD